MATREEFDAHLTATAARIFVRAQVDGRWRSISLADLCVRDPDKGAEHIALFRQRWAVDPEYKPVALKEE